MRQARERSPQGERRRDARGDAHQDALRDEHRRERRREGREYMTRWRANPENRARLHAAAERQSAKRKEVHSQDGGAKVCAFCRRRTAVRRIERLITTRDGFQAVLLPCCADC